MRRYDVQVLILGACFGVATSSVSITEEAPDVCVLDKEVPLSESYVFRTSDHFYNQSFSRHGNRKAHVPSHITSNPLIARQYARWTIAFLQDMSAEGQLLSNETLHIMEAGGGNGQFTFNYLTSLQARWRELETVIPFSKMRYIFNDVDPEMMQFVRNHPRLRKFVDSGTLHFLAARLGEQSFSDLRTETGLELGGTNNPAILIANYFFDALKGDVFRTHNDGTVQEVLFTNTFPCSKAKTEAESVANIDPYSDDVLLNIKHERTFKNIDPSSRFRAQDADLNELLLWYRRHTSAGGHALVAYHDDPPAAPPLEKRPPPFRKPAAKGSEEDDATSDTFMLSASSFRVLRALQQAFAQGGALVLSSDAGADDVAHFREPFAWHHMTTLLPPAGSHKAEPRKWHFAELNLHSFRLFVEQHGGLALSGGVPEGDGSLQTTAYVLPGGRRLPSTAPVAGGEQCRRGQGQEEETSACGEREGERERMWTRLQRGFGEEVMMSHCYQLFAESERTMLGWVAPLSGKTARGTRKMAIRAKEDGTDAKTMARVFVSSMEMVLWDADCLYGLRQVLWRVIRKLDSVQLPSAAVWRGLRRAEAGAYLKDNDLYMVLGVAYSMLGDREGAVRTLSKSLEALGEHAAVRLRRGQALQSLGQRAAAAVDYEAAARLLAEQSCGSYESGSRGELEGVSEIARAVRKKTEEFLDLVTSQMYREALQALEQC